MNKVRVPEPPKTYARRAKAVHVDVSEAHKVEQTGVRATPIMSERGLIGAISAVGLVDQPGTIWRHRRARATIEILFLTFP
jgi:hypothetical protein